MSFMLQTCMKLVVLMLALMSNSTIMTMMMILMMIRPEEGGTFCWLASQPAGLQNAITEFGQPMTLRFTDPRPPRAGPLREKEPL